MTDIELKYELPAEWGKSIIILLMNLLNLLKMFIMPLFILL